MLGPIAVVFALAAPVVWAQEAPVRVRGTIERVDGDTYVVKARGGAELQVKLAPKATVAAVVEASLADIKQGSYVGVAALPLPDGSQKALEVHIFPEAMRGTGDGPPRLGPAAVEHHDQRQRREDRRLQRRPGADAQVQGRREEDRRAADTPIVSYVPGDESELKAGATIFIAAAIKQPDGTLQAPRVNVGRGVAPPM